MSVVTNVMLSFSIGEEDYEAGDGWGHPIVDEINKLLVNDHHGKLVNVARFAGGEKHMETDVYMGAFNIFDTKQFITYVNMMNWTEPEHVQVFVQEQEEYSFTEMKVYKGTGGDVSKIGDWGNQ